MRGVKQKQGSAAMFINLGRGSFFLCCAVPYSPIKEPIIWSHSPEERGELLYYCVTVVPKQGLLMKFSTLSLFPLVFLNFSVPLPVTSLLFLPLVSFPSTQKRNKGFFVSLLASSFPLPLFLFAFSSFSSFSLLTSRKQNIKCRPS